MQSSKVLKVIDWAKSFAFWIGHKVKALLLYILKNPLGSIFWVVKAYFALMFLTLFVACSFGAFAQTATEETRLAKKSQVVICLATAGAEQERFTGADFATCLASAKSALNRIIKLPPASESTPPSSTGSHTKVTRSWSSVTYVLNATSVRSGFKISEQSTDVFCRLNGDGYPECDQTTSPPRTYDAVALISQVDTTDGYVCPPDGDPDFTIGPDPQNLCRKPKPTGDKCWPAGGDWTLAPQYFLSAASSAPKLCAHKDSSSGEKCPWKRVSVGVYVPDPNSTIDCDNEIQEPPLPPPPPMECKTGGNGLKVCDQNPNDKCKPNSTGALTCAAKCGYVNDRFLCFDNPNDPKNDPSKPDKDKLKPVDDLIPDASKVISDMTKGDFKAVLKGTEGRLDNLLTEMANGNKTTESQLDQLLQKEGGEFSKAENLLTSIDENINTISEALTDVGKNPKLEPAEFTEPTNNWKTRNFGTILKEKGDEIVKQPLFTSINKFFKVSFSGTCPQYNVSVWVFEISIDQFCSPSMNALWPYIKAVVLLLCSFVAIRIALL